MRAFKDKNGKNWLIEVNVGNIRKVKAICEIDLSKVIEINDNGINGDILYKLCEDPVLIASVIYAICSTEIEKNGLSEEEFFELFDGDTVQNAVDALIQEIIDFFPPAKRKVLMKVYQKSQDFEKRANQIVDQVLEDENFNITLDSQLNNMLTNSQELSESTQTPSH